MNPKNLSKAEIETLIFLGEGWVCDRIKSADLVDTYDKEKYAAAYEVEFYAPESFDGVLNAAKVFISYLPNGKLIAKI